MHPNWSDCLDKWTFAAGKGHEINNLSTQSGGHEMVEADRGYRDNRCRHCDVVAPRSDGRAKSRAMRKHETAKSDRKTFGCLYQLWRLDLSKYSIAFHANALKYKLEGDQNSIVSTGIPHDAFGKECLLYLLRLVDGIHG